MVDVGKLADNTQAFIPLAESAWEIIHDNTSRDFVYTEIDKQFDGDFNVLFNTMLNKQESARAFKNELSAKIETALTRFQSEKQAKSAYPQIFIPFYQELKEENIIGLRKPIIVLRDGPPNINSTYEGYVFIDTKLASIGMISEADARENEVWVISVNERVDSNGEVENSRLNTYSKSTISRLTIKGSGCMKEDWVGGKVDVNALRWFDNYYKNASSANFYGDGQPGGDRVANVSRKSAKKSTVQYINFNFITGWNTDSPYTSLDYAYYVIFEYDPWPAGTNDAIFGSLVYEYRSYEGYYDKNLIHRNSADNYDVDNICINWVMD